MSLAICLHDVPDPLCRQSACSGDFLSRYSEKQRVHSCFKSYQPLRSADDHSLFPAQDRLDRYVGSLSRAYSTPAFLGSKRNLYPAQRPRSCSAALRGAKYQTRKSGRHFSRGGHSRWCGLNREWSRDETGGQPPFRSFGCAAPSLRHPR